MTLQADRKVEHLQRLATEAADESANTKAKLAELEAEFTKLRDPFTLSQLSTFEQGQTHARRVVELESVLLPAARAAVEEAEQRAKDAATLHKACAHLSKAAYRMVDAGPVPVQLAVGQSYRQAVDEVRRDLDKLDDLRREVRNRGPAHSDAEEAISAFVARLADAGRPTVSSTGTVELPANGRSGWLAGLAWLDPEKMTQRLIAELPQEEPDAITEADRESELAAIAEERLELERVEEALIAKAEAAGQQIDRRPNASAEAVLQVEVRPYGVEAEAEAA